MLQWKFTNIHHSFRRQAEISLNEYAVLDIIYQSQTHPSSRTSDGWAIISYSNMADFLALSKGAVHKIVDRMVFINLLEVDPASPSRKRTTKLWYENAYLDDESKTESGAKLVQFERVQKVNDVQKVNGFVQKVNDDCSKSERFRSKSERNIKEETNLEIKGNKNTQPSGSAFSESDIEDFEEQLAAQKNETQQPPPIAPPSPNFDDDITEVLNELNRLSGRSLLVNGERASGNRDAVSKLFKKKYTKEEILAVVQTKCFEWVNNASMFQYLHPSTLFSKKFQTYLDQYNDLKSNPHLAEQFKKKINATNPINTAYENAQQIADSVARLRAEGY